LLVILRYVTVTVYDRLSSKVSAYGLDSQGLIPGRGRILLFVMFVSRSFAHPAWYLKGSGASSDLIIKLVEIKNVWSITSTSSVHLHSVVLMYGGYFICVEYLICQVQSNVCFFI
jgi:hypothetical protein